MLGGCISLAWMAKLSNFLSADYGCDWPLIALARSALMLVFALLIAASSGVQLVFFRPPALWARSLAGSVSVCCNFYAFSCLSASETLTLSNTFPIWVAFLSWPVLHEKPTRATWLAALCGVAGVALIQWPHLRTDHGLLSNAGVPVALFGALMSAVAMLGLHKLRGIGTSAIVVHFAATATLLVIGVCLVRPARSWEPMLKPSVALLLLGVGTTALLGQICLTRAFSTGHPARVSVVALTQILFALLLDVLFGQPGFHVATLAGIVLVLMPTAWVMLSRGAESVRRGASRPIAQNTAHNNGFTPAPRPAFPEFSESGPDAPEADPTIPASPSGSGGIAPPADS
jgi:drug/metabolite transporter (DMT)-like permease